MLAVKGVAAPLPDSTLVLKSLPCSLHSRRSSSLSATALACSVPHRGLRDALKGQLRQESQPAARHRSRV